MTPRLRGMLARAAPTAVEALAAYLEDAVTTLHHRFAPGYGGLTGVQNGLAPRSLQGRLRLLVERHYVDALRIGGREATCWLDYPDDDTPLDDQCPTALVVACQFCEPVVRRDGRARDHLGGTGGRVPPGRALGGRRLVGGLLARVRLSGPGRPGSAVPRSDRLTPSKARDKKRPNHNPLHPFRESESATVEESVRAFGRFLSLALPWLVGGRLDARPLHRPSA